MPIASMSALLDAVNVTMPFADLAVGAASLPPPIFVTVSVPDGCHQPYRVRPLISSNPFCALMLNDVPHAVRTPLTGFNLVALI